ncbi:MAG: hypothetical protein R2851_26765 [Caldilineaceae bacterium]
MQHVNIYREEGRFAGWPANYGIWAWGDEIVLGFTVGYHNPDGGFHTRDKTRPFVATQARSLDGGESWQLEGTPWPTPGNRGVLSADEHVEARLSAADAIASGLANQPAPCPGDVDFTNPDFALMCARTGLGTGTVSWFYLSTDRCQRRGLYALSMFGQPGIEARTDYLVSGLARNAPPSSSPPPGPTGRRRGILASRALATVAGHLTYMAGRPGGRGLCHHAGQRALNCRRRIRTAVRCRRRTLSPSAAGSTSTIVDDGRSFQHLGDAGPRCRARGNRPSMIADWPTDGSASPTVTPTVRHPRPVERRRRRHLGR